LLYLSNEPDVFAFLKAAIKNVGLAAIAIHFVAAFLSANIAMSKLYF